MSVRRKPTLKDEGRRPEAATEGTASEALSAEEIQALLAPYGSVLTRLQQQFDTGPVSVEKLQQRPEALRPLISGLASVAAAMGPHAVISVAGALVLPPVSKELVTLLKKLAAYKKSRGAFVVRSAEGNIELGSGFSTERLKKALEQQIGGTAGDAPAAP